ncbi:AAA family ATPase [Pseudomonas sp. RIT288]|jgi:predicted ATPase|uniref:AAA family ATPase n=1 Tax=Pseudomonas sp. RIT288 TaxID=1470589 RepID=UPI0004478BC6|nr:AAA family ATPase [Pseudomonas sp. RIT288]EZP26473.1 hypothetical protein BW33_04891 [Pseudomonas sp. RIT288]
MPRLRVKHFGPIQNGVTNDGWIEFKRVTVFVGNQGSGKSTLAKLYSTFSWIEKALERRDYDKSWFEEKDRLTNTFLPYHRLENYISSDQKNQTEIDYEGDAFTIKYAHGRMHITKSEAREYHLPQIMYVPAERNFISYLRNPEILRLNSPSLTEFLTEFNYAKENIAGSLALPINNANLEYDVLKNTLSIREATYRLELADASSGFQSAVPLYLVSQYLAKQVFKPIGLRQDTMSSKELERFRKEASKLLDESLTIEQQRAVITTISKQFNKTAFINIVEEPEQNLYPNSQWRILQSLLEINNQGADNHLVMTTHSPYVVNYLTIAVQGKQLHDNILKKKRDVDLMPELAKVIPLKSLLDADELAIYQADEKTGSIARLPMVEGIPSDSNYLNASLRESSDIFDRLLDIEEELEA